MPALLHTSARGRVGFVSAAVLLGLLAWQGHHVAARIPELEARIAGLGPWGPLAYAAGVLILAPLLVPDSVFGITAGVAFGLGKGFVWYFGAVYAACLLEYWIARRWLRGPVRDALARRPALTEMVEAARRRGARVTFWIRLVPLNPAVVSYALGAVEVAPRAVAIGTLGMFPHMFATVYLGVAAAHVTQMAGAGHASWTSNGVLLLAGLAVCGLLVFRLSAVAWRQIRRAEEDDDAKSR